MPPDPVLDFLLAAERSTSAAHEAARAALVAYQGCSVPDTDLIALRDVEIEFGVANVTARRWAKDKHLGVKIEGKLYLKRSLLKSRARR